MENRRVKPKKAGSISAGKNTCLSNRLENSGSEGKSKLKAA